LYLIYLKISIGRFEMPATKSIFTSKTAIVNTLTTIVAILSFLDPTLIGVDARYLLMASGIVNIILRAVTTGGVSLTGSSGS